MGLGLLLWAVLAVLRNIPFVRYLVESPGAFDLSCLSVFLGTTAGPALAAALVFISLWGCGRRLCRLLAVPDDGALAALPLALGVGLFGTLLLAAGMAGRLELGIRLLLAAFLLAGLYEARGLLRTPPAWRPRGASPPWKTALAVALAFIAFHALVNDLAPPVGWDALAYHLAIPRLYLEGDAVREIPWLLHSHWPHLLEMIYAAPLALGQEPLAALLHGLLCAALVLTVFRVGRDEGGEAAGWTAAALLAAQPLFLELVAEPHCDGALALFHLLACLALWRWSKEGGRGLLAAAGLCSGLAIATKLQGLALAGALFVWLLLDSRRRAGAALFALCSALPAAPWLLKTWLATGNPVWPLYSSVFGGRWEPALIAQGLDRNNLWRFPRDAALLWRYGPQFLLLPAAGLSALAIGRSRSFPPRLLFLFLATAPLAALTVRYHEAWRYLTPLLPIGALACGWWCAQACREPGFRRVAACLVVACGLRPAAGLSQGNELFAVLALHSRAMPGLPARQVYRARQLPFVFFYEKAAALVPRGGKVLLFREIRGYHLRAAYQWGDPVIQTQIIYDRLPSPDALRSELDRQGLTFVLVNEGSGLYSRDEDYYSGRTLALMDAMLARYGREVLREGALALYELRPSAPPR